MEAIVIATDTIPAAELVGENIVPKFSTNFRVHKGSVSAGKIANYAKMEITKGTVLAIEPLQGESVITSAMC